MSKIEFHHSLSCALDESRLFAWLIETLRDTDLEELWPRGLNRVRIPLLETGRVFETEYRFPLRKVKLPYRVAEVLPGVGFSYAPAAGHPFHGLVHVRVAARPGGSVLIWHGSYEAPWWRPERAVFRRYFEPRFFKELERGLARL